MKKLPPRKLVLKTETIRQLNHEQLGNAAGGITATSCIQACTVITENCVPTQTCPTTPGGGSVYTCGRGCPTNQVSHCLGC